MCYATDLVPEEIELQPGSDSIETQVTGLINQWASLALMDMPSDRTDPTQLQHLIMYIRDIISPWDPLDLAIARSPFNLGPPGCTATAIQLLASQPLDLQNMPIKAPHSPVIVNDEIRCLPAVLTLLADTVSFHLAVSAVVYGRFVSGDAERGHASVQLRSLHSIAERRIEGFAQKITWLERCGHTSCADIGARSYASRRTILVHVIMPSDDSPFSSITCACACVSQQGHPLVRQLLLVRSTHRQPTPLHTHTRFTPTQHLPQLTIFAP